MSQRRKAKNFFEREAQRLEKVGKGAAAQAALLLRSQTASQVRRAMDAKLVGGISVYHFPPRNGQSASVVRLSPPLSAAAVSSKIQGDPYLWILLPDGKKLGFKRISNSNTWISLKRKYGDKLSMRKSNGGVNVYYSYRGRSYAVYKLSPQVNSPQKIEFLETAENIAKKLGIDYVKG